MGFEDINKKDYSKIADPNLFGAEEAINYVIKSGQMRDAVYARDDVQQFLKEIDLGNAMEWADRIDRFEVWQLVIHRPDMTKKKAIACAKKFHDTKVNAVVEEYLKNS